MLCEGLVISIVAGAAQLLTAALDEDDDVVGVGAGFGGAYRSGLGSEGVEVVRVDDAVNWKG